MNLAEEIEAVARQTVEWRRHRRASRAPFRDLVRATVRGADRLRQRVAQSGWGYGAAEVMDARPIGGNLPSLAAQRMVRDVLSNFDFPRPPEVSVARPPLRQAGRGPHGMRDGTLTVEATLRSLSNVAHHIETDIHVIDGKMMRPAVFRHNGQIHLFEQPEFDEILKRGEFFHSVSDRMTMFSPPPDEPIQSHGERKRAPAYQNSMFDVPPSHAVSRRTMFSSRRTADSTTAPATFGPEGLDTAERPMDDYLAPDQNVAAAKKFVIRDRGGAAYTIAEGTRGVVVRDCEGDNRVYIVRFPDVGKVRVSRDVLRARRGGGGGK